MKEPCRFYSLLLPIRQHDALTNLSRKDDVAVAVLIRRGVELLLEQSKLSKEAKEYERNSQ